MAMVTTIATTKITTTQTTSRNASRSDRSGLSIKVGWPGWGGGAARLK